MSGLYDALQEVRRLKDELILSHQLIQAALNSSPHAVVIADASGKVVYQSEMSKTLLNPEHYNTPDHWQDDYSIRYLDREDEIAIEDYPLFQGLQGVHNGGVRHWRIQDKIVFVEQSGPLYDEDKNLIGAFVAFRERVDE